jgi:hypothetical protein
MWMVVNCTRLLHSALLKILGLPHEVSMYVGVFKQKDGKLRLSVRKPSQEEKSENMN